MNNITPSVGLVDPACDVEIDLVHFQHTDYPDASVAIQFDSSGELVFVYRNCTKKEGADLVSRACNYGVSQEENLIFGDGSDVEIKQ